MKFGGVLFGKLDFCRLNIYIDFSFGICKLFGLFNIKLVFLIFGIFEDCKLSI